MRKFISSILIPFLLLYFSSCYTMSNIPKEEIKKESGKGKIIIITKDLETYQFDESHYYIQSDTLFGSGLKIIEEMKSIPFKGQIPLDIISRVNMEKLNFIASFFLGAGILVGFGILCLIVVGTAWVNAFSSGAHKFGTKF